MDNVLAIIPARSGSKGLKNKNIRIYKGIPLAVHSYLYAKKSSIVRNVLISTDSEEYQDVFLNSGVERNDIRIRPKSLGEDNVSDYPVALDAWTYAEETQGINYEYIAFLRPTSPLRQPNLIEDSIKIITSNPKVTSVRAVRAVSEHPYRIWSCESEFIYPLIKEVYEPGNISRQDLPTNFYFQSGEIELLKRDTIQRGSISGGNVKPIIISEINPDIDLEEDWSILEK